MQNPFRSRSLRRVTWLPGRGAAAGSVPLRHFGSLHSIADAATGGTPLMQSGVVQPLVGAAAGSGPPLHAAELVQVLAAAAVRLSEPAARALR